MELGLTNIFVSIGAGLASVLSPCVLPVIPVIVAGSTEKDRLRPLLIVIGLSITFMLMGIVSSLFGTMLVGKMRSIEQVGGGVIALFGLLIILNINVFKRLYRLQNININTEGKLSGLVLGLALGIVWIPCIGPVLSGILAMVATSGEITKGAFFLGFYSVGFAIPMLAVGYSSHIVQRKLRAIQQHEALVRYITGGVLVFFGLYIVIKGNFAF
jgi:cytochrome c-type biogenesis protein